MKVLRILNRRVLDPQAGMPAAVQADIWGDAALAQLVAISARQDMQYLEEGEPTQRKRRRQQEGDDSCLAGQQVQRATGGGAVRVKGGKGAPHAGMVAVRAAHEVLLMLLTDPSHGLVALQQQQLQSLRADMASSAPVAPRALRVLLALQPGHAPLHAELLAAVAQAQPALASELLAVLPWQMEPKPTAHWLACAAVVALLLKGAAVGPSAGAGMAAGVAPPGVESAGVRAALACCLPPALGKVRG